MSKPMPGINVEAFIAWCEKLESGDVPQGTGRLHNIDGSMCCLGVVCYLAAPMLGLKVNMNGNAYLYQIKNNYLPREVVEYLGIPESHIHGSYESGFDIVLTPPVTWVGDTVDGMVLVSVLNDNGYTHPQIAGFLRKEFLECDD